MQVSKEVRKWDTVKDTFSLHGGAPDRGTRACAEDLNETITGAVVYSSYSRLTIVSGRPCLPLNIVDVA